MDVDFGYRRVPTTGTAVIGDTVWWDTNQNGVQDPGEAGIAGVPVTLTTPSGTVISDDRDEREWQLPVC